MDALWKAYRTSIKALRAGINPQSTRSNTNVIATPGFLSGCFASGRDAGEWKELIERLISDKRRFEYRESLLWGFGIVVRWLALYASTGQKASSWYAV